MKQFRVGKNSPITRQKLKNLKSITPIERGHDPSQPPQHQVTHAARPKARHAPQQPLPQKPKKTTGCDPAAARSENLDTHNNGDLPNQTQPHTKVKVYRQVYNVYTCYHIYIHTHRYIQICTPQHKRQPGRHSPCSCFCRCHLACGAVAGTLMEIPRNLGRGLSHWDFLGLQVEFQVEVHPPDGSSDFLYHGGPNISFQVAGVSFIGESNGPQFLRDTFEIYKKS